MPSGNLSHLAVFAAVARHASFRKAGAELGLSTSAVSYAIRGMETQLGVNLFNRTTRSVALTEAGARLLERLRPVLRDLGDAMDEMNRYRETPTGTLRLNVARLAAQLLVVPLAKQFLQQYPGLHLEVVEDDNFVDIVGAGFDAGVRHDVLPEDMVAVTIDCPFRAAVVAAPEYLAGRVEPRHPLDLLEHDCIRYRFPSGRYFRWDFNSGEEALEVDVRGPLALSDIHSVIRAASDGVGIGYAVEAHVRPLLAQGRLVRLLEDWCPVLPGFMLYYPKQRRVSSALRAFIDLAKAAAPALALEGAGAVVR